MSEIDNKILNEVLEPFINKDFKSIDDDNVIRFKSEYYSKWIEPSKEYQEAYKLWLWYNYHCELYDSIICTGSNEYEDYIPRTNEENMLINKHARSNWKIIYEERRKLKQEGIDISEEDWQAAKRHLVRYKLKALEQEYKIYFPD